VAKLGDHKPGGPFSGGKYSKLEAGCRVPLIVSWPGKTAPAVSAAAVSQIDLLASFAALVGQPVPAGDSQNMLDALLGKTRVGRDAIVMEGIAGLALRSGEWKYIPPFKGQAKFKDMRSGHSPQPQLYHLADNPAETQNLAVKHPEKVKELAAMLDAITGTNLPAPEPHDFK
jgi:arylsulfatase A-like enzyme